jgi:hypothetical protein
MWLVKGTLLGSAIFVIFLFVVVYQRMRHGLSTTLSQVRLNLWPGVFFGVRCGRLPYLLSYSRNFQTACGSQNISGMTLAPHHENSRRQGGQQRFNSVIGPRLGVCPKDRFISSCLSRRLKSR